MFNKKRIVVFVVFVLLMFFMSTFAGGPVQNASIVTRDVIFTDSFNNENISEQKVELGKAATVPEDPVHRNFVFAGWFLFDDHDVRVRDFDRIMEDTHVIALYDDDINNNGIADRVDTYYTVRFIDSVNGRVLKTERVLLGMDATAPTPETKEGYVFAGWDRAYTNVRRNLDVNTVYNTSVVTKTHTVTFVDGETGRVINTQVVEEGRSATTPESPEHDKRVFDYYDGEYTDVTEDKTIVITYTDDKNDNDIKDYLEPHYTIEFTSVGRGTLKGTTKYENILVDLSFEDAGIIVPVPVPEEYYKSNGWDKTIVPKVTDNAVYTLTFVPINDENNNGIADEEEYRTVKYTDGVNGSVFEDVVFDKALDGLSTPEFEGSLERKDYVFTEWTPEIKEVVDGDATYTANWKDDKNNNGTPDEEETFKVIYKDGEEELKTVDNLKLGDELEKYTPEKEDYVFTEWTPEWKNAVAAEDANTDSEIIYTANWKDDKNNNDIPDEEEERVAITFNAGEHGTINEEATYTTEKNLLKGYDKYPEAPEVEAARDYVFVGWEPEYKAGEMIALENAVLEFTAQYKDDKNNNDIPDDEEERVAITFNAGEHGTINEEATYTTEKNLLKGYDKYPEAPEVEAARDYVFVGWEPEYKAGEMIALENAVLEFTAQYKDDKNNNGTPDEEETFKVIYKDEEKELKTVDNLKLGDELEEYTPEKEANAQYTYTFTEWTPEWKNTVAAEDANTDSEIIYTANWRNTVNKYTIKFVDEDGTALQSSTVEYGTVPTTPVDPTKEADAQYTYTFAGWTPEVVAVTEDATYTATYNSVVNKYTVTFKNEGEVIERQVVEYGSAAVAPAMTPTKPATAQYTFTFTGWDKDFSNITGNLEVNAQYSSTTNEYTIKFVNEDGSELQTSSVAYGTVPTAPADPTKEADAQYTYTFDSWTPEIVAVTGGATYTATYTKTTNEYTIKFVDEDGSELQTSSVAYGTVPTTPADPTKEADVQYTYTFAGWTPEVVAVTGEATYTATYNSVVNKYTIKFVNEGTTVSEKEYDYGTLAADIEVPATPTKEADAQYTYTFDSWTPTIENVTEDATYTATYTSTTNEYTIKFVDEDGSELQTSSVAYGTVPTAPADPTKEADAQYTYTFAGWTPEIVAVTGEATYTATYNSVVNKYTIKFVNEGTTVSEKEYDYGTLAADIEVPATPTKEADAQYTYTFDSWTPTIENVTEDATYTATYDKELRSYIVTFKSDDTVLKTETVAYGSAATAPANPTKENWTFKEWDKDYSNITGDLTVNAVYTPNQIGIRVEELPNVNWVFQKGTAVDLTKLIIVFEVYADGTEIATTSYTNDLTTAYVVDDKVLTISENGFTDTSITYKVQNEAASQSKFEVILKTDSKFRRTTSSNCTTNCDTTANTTEVTLSNTIFEVIEHYDENIKVTSIVAKYSTGSKTLTNLYAGTRAPFGEYNNSGSVRWSRVVTTGPWWNQSSALYDPTYIYGIGTRYDNLTEDVSNDTNVATEVDVTYIRRGYGTYTVKFKPINGEYKAVDEEKISNVSTW